MLIDFLCENLRQIFLFFFFSCVSQRKAGFPLTPFMPSLSLYGDQTLFSSSSEAISQLWSLIILLVGLIQQITFVIFSLFEETFVFWLFEKEGWGVSLLMIQRNRENEVKCFIKLSWLLSFSQRILCFTFLFFFFFYLMPSQKWLILLNTTPISHSSTSHSSTL